MKCESCHSNDATVQVKQVADGLVKEVFLCAGCAQKSGLKSPAAMADFLFGATDSPVLTVAATTELKSCPVCHMRGTDLKKNARLGCESCYETFSDDLLPMIETMHRSLKHIGKTSVREQSRAEIAALETQLKRAVELQAFEDAAGIRDEIKALESQRLSENV
jgi:protein arginine kinase activator